MSTENRPNIVDVKVIDLLGRAEVTSIVVNGTAVVFSDTFQLQEGRVYAFDYQMAVGATVDVKLELEQSNDLPTTESAIDTKYVVPEDAADLDVSLTDKLRHLKAYAPAATRFARFKITGQGTNSADTAVSRLKVSHIKG